jgi:NAD+ diphosphatase
MIGGTTDGPAADIGPRLGRAVVDRAAHRRRDPDWLAEAWERAGVLLVDSSGRAPVTEGADGPELLLLDGRAAAQATGPDADPEERYFLGEDDERAYFVVRAEVPAGPRLAAGARSAGLREVGADLGERDVDLLVTALALLNWHETHGFSPVTGAPTVPDEAGWVRQSSDAGPPVFPRTDPAVIMLVSDGVDGPGGRALLGRQASWPPDRWSCLAGFVEPGESAEAAVLREVREETSVRAHTVRYLASQPWPFPGSLMLGFTALADPDDPIVVDTTELEDARWFTREELTQVRARASSPPPISIAYVLITRWLAGL